MAIGCTHDTHTTYHHLCPMFITYMQNTTPFAPTLLPSHAEQMCDCQNTKLQEITLLIADTVHGCDLDLDLDGYPGSCYAVWQALVGHAPGDPHAVLARLVQLSVARLRDP